MAGTGKEQLYGGWITSEGRQGSYRVPVTVNPGASAERVIELSLTNNPDESQPMSSPSGTPPQES